MINLIVLLLVLAVVVVASEEMDHTAKRDPQTVCLTLPWLDVKPPC